MEGAVNFFEAALHVAEAVVGAGGGEVFDAAGDDGGRNSGAIVFDFENEAVS